MISTLAVNPTSRRRVLLVGHAGIPTGFARVLGTLASHLAAVFDVHLLAITQPAVEHGAELPYTVHANSAVADGPHRLHDPVALRALVERLQPALCFMLDEPWVCAQRLETLSHLAARPRTLCYLAADEPAQLPSTLLPTLAQADSLVLFTDTARRMVAEAFVASGLPSPPLHVIPHGVDSAAFFPISRTEARARLFPDLDPSAFVVLNANRNQPYKRVDLTLAGFARFAIGKGPEVRLCLHMASRPRSASTPAWVDRLGIRNRVLHAGPACTEHPHLPDAQLNLLYNCANVGINTSDREGFGLVAFEHGATGAAQVVPALPALCELWGDSAVLLPTTSSANPRLPGRVAPTASPESIAEALEGLYTDIGRRLHLGDAARRNALAECFGWDTAAATWVHLFRQLIH